MSFRAESRNLYISKNQVVNRFLAPLEMTEKFLNLMVLIWNLEFHLLGCFNLLEILML